MSSIWVIVTNCRLWVKSVRYSFKWVKIKLPFGTSRFGILRLEGNALSTSRQPGYIISYIYLPVMASANCVLFDHIYKGRCNHYSTNKLTALIFWYLVHVGLMSCQHAEYSLLLNWMILVHCRHFVHCSDCTMFSYVASKLGDIGSLPPFFSFFWLYFVQHICVETLVNGLWVCRYVLKNICGFYGKKRKNT